jgi:ubiquinone/menaquinone biosynthesis C-methylase UbiE
MRDKTIGYNFNKYVGAERFASYYVQLKYIYELDPGNILEIGFGNGFLKRMISTDFMYTALDRKSRLHPDIVGEVTQMPFKDGAFELAVCFEVLEHLEQNKFETALKEIKRVTTKNAVISLPYDAIQFSFSLNLPLLRYRHVELTIPKFYKFNKQDEESRKSQHYWEIGRKGTSLNQIIGIMGKHFTVKEVKKPENLHMIFFVLEKNENALNEQILK